MKPISLNFIVLLSSLSLFLSHEMHGQKGTVRIHKNSQIDTLIKLKKEVNLSELNYKIQIFRGISRKPTSLHPGLGSSLKLLSYVTVRSIIGSPQSGAKIVID